MNFVSPRRVVVALGAAACIITGCSLLLKTSPAPSCATDGDCSSRGGAFSGSFCDVPSGKCVSTPSTLPDAGDAGGVACTNNKQCVDTHAGEPWICSKTSSRCVSLKSPECPFVIEDEASKLVSNDEVIVIGAFAGLSGTAPLLDPFVLPFRLALKELADVAGLPPAARPGRRPVVAVLCDATTAESTAAAVSHLVDEVKPPAVVTFFTPADTARYFQDKFLPAGIFTLNPGATTVALNNTPGSRGLIWHLLGPSNDLGAAYVPTLRRAENYIKNVRGLPAGDGGMRGLKVAMISTDDPSDQGTTLNFRQQLFFNGMSAGDNETAATKTYLSTQIPALATHPGTNYSTQFDAVLTFAPDVIIGVGVDEISVSLLNQIEGNWASRNPGKPRPFYILGDRVPLSPITTYILTGRQGGESIEEARKRFIGIQFSSARDLSEKRFYVGRLQDKYGVQYAYDYTENQYDAFYWLFYGIAASGTVVDLTGEDIGRGVRKLLSGAITVKTGGGDPLSQSLNALVVGNRASFVGTLGPPDIDVDTGARRGKGSVYCFREQAGNIAVTYDTLLYEASTDGGAATLVASPYSDHQFCFSLF